MAEPDEAWSGGTRAPSTSRGVPARPSPEGTRGAAAAGIVALLPHRFGKALASWRIRLPRARPGTTFAVAEGTGAITVQGGMMLDDAGTWARLVATRLPASGDAPGELTCTLTLYAPDGEAVSSATATERWSPIGLKSLLRAAMPVFRTATHGFRRPDPVPASFASRLLASRSLASRFPHGSSLPLGRPSASLETVALLLSMFFAVACNHPFWAEAMAGRDASQFATWSFAAAVLIALVGLHFLVLCLVPGRRAVKPLWSLLIVATAVATYYMNAYAIYLDPSMLRSVLATEAKESRDLLAGGLARHVLVFAGLPLACLWSVRLRARSPLRALQVRLATITGAAVIVSMAVLLSFQDLSALMRNHREMRYLVTPANFLYSTARALSRPAKADGAPLIPVGPDAHLAAAWQTRERPVLFVMVLGETARAANWGLNGYARQTTPQLAALDVINFSHVRSCGTDTETSVPCLFSPLGRKHYDVGRIRGSESLLHVLRRAGFNVVWRDNNTGCKGVCTGIGEERVDRGQYAEACDADGDCVDEVLLHGLDTVARDDRGNLFIVLHQVGNHGPAYSRRYPAAFRRFQPACETVELRLCDRREIVNAYDNALLYTDHVLADTIAFLQAQEGRYDTAMLYVSDHGESLGENGLYLHGIPYPIAPDVQTQVPMVMWFSPGFLHSFRLDEGCLRRRALQPATHDHVFHSVLGLLQVETRVSDPTLDLSRECIVG